MKKSYSENILASCASLSVKYSNKNGKVSILKQKKVARLLKYNAMSKGKFVHAAIFDNYLKGKI